MTEILRGVNERLIDVLLAQKLLSQEDLDRVLELQKEKNRSFICLLVEMKLVDAKVLMGILSPILQIPTISLANMKMDKRLEEIIPRKLAFHYQMVPLSRLGKQLTVATANPLDVLATDLLAQVTGLNLVLLLATPEEIQDALQRLYGGAITDTLSELKGADEEANLLVLPAAEKGAEGGGVESLLRLTQEGPIVKVTNALLKQGVHLRASDILVEPFEKKLRIRYRVDGIFREGQSPPAADARGDRLPRQGDGQPQHRRAPAAAGRADQVFGG